MVLVGNPLPAGSLVGHCHPPPSAKYNWTKAFNSLPCACVNVNSAENAFVSFVSTSKIVRASGLEAHLRQAGRILRGLHQQLLLNPEFTIFAISNQSVGHVTESALDGLLVG